ncbi:MAG TPA: 3'-5' exonuclease [Ignavibacteriaceae bacterium]|nr:3'-5' exonuclease [Ignavibacteriaceae bacterium]
MTNNICFIDFETTGTNVFADEPIELGAVLVNHKLQQIDTFFSKIKPSRDVNISESAYQIHKYRIEDLKNEPNQLTVMNSFFNIFGFDYYLAGWNISFDVPFLRKLCNSNGMLTEFDKIDYHHLDVQSIVKFLVHINLLPNNITSLSKCAEYFGIPRHKNHNALEDAYITFNLYKKIKDELSGLLVSKSIT